MRKPGYFLRETLQGFRRNGLVVLAAVSTVFIALFLLGGALLMQRQVNLLINAFEANIQVAVFLQTDISPAQTQNIDQILNSMPQVQKPVVYMSQQQAYQQAKTMFRGNPNILNGVTAADLPASFRVNLVNPSEFPVVSARLQGQPGIDHVVDNSSLFKRILALGRVSRLGFAILALIMLVSATGLIANTVRVAVFARRKEIEIMRLVGATNWTIRIPFLLEGLIQGLVGAGLAIVALFIMKTAFISQVRLNIQFLPIIGTSDVIWTVPILALVAAGVALLASFLATRKFLEV